MRDLGLLESAPAESDVPLLAAVYAIAIARNHPFVDGNKRVAFVALETFLELNAQHLTANDTACTAEILALAAGDRTDDEFIEWVRNNAQPRSSSGRPKRI